METLHLGLWQILGIITLLGLLLFYKGKNAVWGNFTLGILLGLLTATAYYFTGHGFSWKLIGKTAIVGALLGLLFEVGQFGRKV